MSLRLGKEPAGGILLKNIDKETRMRMNETSGSSKLKKFLVMGALVLSPIAANAEESSEDDKDPLYRRVVVDPVKVGQVNDVLNRVVGNVKAGAPFISEFDLKMKDTVFTPVYSRVTLDSTAVFSQHGSANANLTLYKVPNPLRFGMVEGAKLETSLSVNDFGSLKLRFPLENIDEECAELEEDADSELERVEAELVLCKVILKMKNTKTFAEFQKEVDPYLAQAKQLATDALRDQVGEARRLVAYNYKNQRCSWVGGALCTPHIKINFGGTAAIAGLSGFIKIESGKVTVSFKVESVSWFNGRFVEELDIESLEEGLYEALKVLEKYQDEDVKEISDAVADIIADIKETLDEIVGNEEEDDGKLALR